MCCALSSARRSSVHMERVVLWLAHIHHHSSYSNVMWACSTHVILDPRLSSLVCAVETEVESGNEANIGIHQVGVSFFA